MNKPSVLTAALLLAGLSTTPLFATAASSTTISGAIEIEAGFSEDYNGVSGSDIATATVELGIDSTVNDKVSTHILLLHEDGDTIAVDEASLSINMGEGLSLTAGQVFLPFGSHESNMISDSLTLGLAEAQETVVQFDYQSGAINSSFYLFNGDVVETGAEESIDGMGFNIAYATDDLTFGVSYINNIADSDSITAVVTPSVVSYVAGMSVYANASFGNTSIIFEHTAALDAFDVAEVALAGTTPTATNLEVGFAMDNAVFAIAAQSSSEALGLGLPETRVLVSYTRELIKDTSLAFEYSSDEDYSLADGGTGNTASATTVKLAVGF
ncbi:MAG: LbtU family siderophore porin [Gammaproteobacteria bacterium]|nr:LbtU family siderophore porin [Gammaproteobacteria bacterium]